MIKNVFLGNPDVFPEKFRNKYDVVTCTGVLLHEHCGPEIFDEMLHALKVGGYAVFSTRAAFIESDCKIRMEDLAETNKWEFISKERFSRHDKISELVEGFQSIPALMYVYKIWELNKL